MVPCCPEITHPLLVDDIFFKIDERTIIFLWKGVKCFCDGVRKSSRTVPATSGRISIFFQTLSICWILVHFWLQALLENILCVKNIHARYLKGPPGSGFYNGNKIMVIQRINHFLLKKTFIPPKCRIWKSLLYMRNRTLGIWRNLFGTLISKGVECVLGITLQIMLSLHWSWWNNVGVNFSQNIRIRPPRGLICPGQRCARVG